MPYIPCEKIRGLVPYDPVEGEYRIRLDANESFFLPTDEDCARIAQAVADTALNRYPDPMARVLCGAFAQLYGVNPELVTAGNGSDELLFVLASAFLQKGDAVLTLSPDFSMYRFYAEQAEARCVTLDKREDLLPDIDKMIAAVRAENVRMVMFSNPCNPTSRGVPADEVRRLIAGCPDALIVLDEAYMDFWDQSLLHEIGKYDNLIILRTASKALGLAALRVGFAVASPALTRLLRAAKSPYNVGAVTQAMAAVVLENSAYLREYVPLILSSRDMLVEGLRAFGFEVYDSCTNFAFVRTDHAAELYNKLAGYGIIVRQFGGKYLRITAGTEYENNELLRCLKGALI